MLLVMGMLEMLLLLMLLLLVMVMVVLLLLLLLLLVLMLLVLVLLLMAAVVVKGVGKGWHLQLLVWILRRVEGEVLLAHLHKMNLRAGSTWDK
jgi:hypothetical protein